MLSMTFRNSHSWIWSSGLSTLIQSNVNSCLEYCSVCSVRLDYDTNVQGHLEQSDMGLRVNRHLWLLKKSMVSVLTGFPEGVELLAKCFTLVVWPEILLVLTWQLKSSFWQTCRQRSVLLDTTAFQSRELFLYLFATILRLSLRIDWLGKLVNRCPRQW